MFILSEIITCGHTKIIASALSTKINLLLKVIPAKGITGFQNQFYVKWIPQTLYPKLHCYVEQKLSLSYKVPKSHALNSTCIVLMNVSGVVVSTHTQLLEQVSRKPVDKDIDHRYNGTIQPEESLNR